MAYLFSKWIQVITWLFHLQCRYQVR